MVAGREIAHAQTLDADSLLHLSQQLSQTARTSPEVWGWPEFLYLSAATQFTVGYGDIVPNSTGTRLAVLIQTTGALVLLAGFANVAIAERQSPPTARRRRRPFGNFR